MQKIQEVQEIQAVKIKLLEQSKPEDVKARRRGRPEYTKPLSSESDENGIEDDFLLNRAPPLPGSNKSASFSKSNRQASAQRHKQIEYAGSKRGNKIQSLLKSR